MSFPQSIASVFRQYVGFRGRARRSEYWWFVLFSVLVGLVAGSLDAVLGLADNTGNGPIGGLATLAILLPSLAVSVRRLHDTSRSGWWVLIGLVPLVGAIVLIVFFCQDSTAGANEHGPNPKGVEGAGGWGGPAGYGAGYGTPAEPPAAPGYGTPQGYGQAAPDPRFGTPPQG